MWFEIAVIAMLLLLGHILFGHFEEKTPRRRKLLKAALTIALFSRPSRIFSAASGFGRRSRRPRFRLC